MKQILFLLFLFITLYSNSQDQVPDLITDRPDQTESSAIVPLKSFQIETGFIIDNDQSTERKFKSLTYNTTLLRYGLFERMELRIGLSYFSVQEILKTTNSKTKVDGFSPLYTGFKIFICEEKGVFPEIAFLGGLALPVTAQADFKAPFTAPSMRFAFTNTLSEKFSLGYNLGAEWGGETAISDYYYSVVVGMAVSEKIGSFIESFGFIPEVGRANHLIDAGLTYLVLPNFQLDISGGFGLNETAGDSFLSFGFSYRIPH